MQPSSSLPQDSGVLLLIGEKLYLKPDKADVYFWFESSGELIPAHKILLASGSNVFEKMFYGSLKEKDEISIVDVSAEVFRKFLQFFYFNKVDVKIEETADIMYLGHKYDVDGCLEVCANILTNHITIDNLVSTYGLAIGYNVKQLQQQCESKIRTHSKAIFQTNSFLECDKEVLYHILKIDYLPCSVTEVFEACMLWTRAISGEQTLTREIMQTHFGNLLYEIHFETISIDEFFKLLPSYGHLFSGNEYNEILQIISNQNIQPTMFKSNRSIWNDDCAVECELSSNFLFNDHYNLDKLETTAFSTNIPLLLGKFTCSPIFNIDNGIRVTNLPVIAKILSHSQYIEAENLDCIFTDLGAEVILPKPILIKPGIHYEIRLSFPEFQYFTIRELNSKIELKSNAYLQLWDPPVRNNRVRGVIHKITVNFIE